MEHDFERVQEQVDKLIEWSLPDHPTIQGDWQIGSRLNGKSLVTLTINDDEEKDGRVLWAFEVRDDDMMEFPGGTYSCSVGLCAHMSQQLQAFVDKHGSTEMCQELLRTLVERCANDKHDLDVVNWSKGYQHY